MVAGAADTVAVVFRGTVVQLSTPDTLLGRAAAAEQIVGQAGPDVGNLRGGLVAAATSGTEALVSGGLACVMAALAIAATTPELRRALSTGTPGWVSRRRGRRRCRSRCVGVLGELRVQIRVNVPVPGTGKPNISQTPDPRTREIGTTTTPYARHTV